MSVKHNKDGGGNAEVKKELQEVKRKTQEVKAAGENTAALLAMSFKAQIVQDRAAKTNIISDAMILQSAEVIEYPEYEDAHAYNTVGEIIKYNGRYYEIIAAHTSNAVSYPVETTFAYYRLVELTHTGTIDDPIPYPETAGIVVNVVSGLYYSYNGGDRRKRPKREILQLQRKSLSCKSGYATLRISARYTFLVAMGRSNRKGGITDGRRDFNRPFRN